jgi:hypothetical protein
MRIDLPAISSASFQLLQIGNEGDRRLWDQLVDAALFPDVYYRPGYLKAYEAAGYGRAAALIVDIGGGRVLIPVLLRSLSELSFAGDSHALDAITAYGYGGLLLLDSLERLDAEQVRTLLNNIRLWSNEVGLVSLLMRLHPMLMQTEWLNASIDEACTVHQVGPTIALQTRHWNESTMCINTLGKGRRSDLSFARRHLRVTWASQRSNRDEDIHTFVQLYEDRMDQLRAIGFYHFPQAYYSMLAEGLNDQLDIAIAWLGKEPVGAAIFMADRRFAHYHLSSSNEVGRTNKATTLLINEAVAWARGRGCEYLHLGGGVSGEDNLFAFKKSFGGEIFEYAFLGIITDRTRYQALLQQRLAEPQSTPGRPNFFPQYRA